MVVENYLKNGEKFDSKDIVIDIPIIYVYIKKYLMN